MDKPKVIQIIDVVSTAIAGNRIDENFIKSCIYGKVNMKLYEHLLGKYRGYDGDFFQFYLGTDVQINRALLENLGIQVEPDKYPDYDSRIVAQVVQGKKRFDIYPFEVEAFNRYAMFGNNNALSCLKGISPTARADRPGNGINEYGNALNWSQFWIKASLEDKALLVDHVLNISEG